MLSALTMRWEVGVCSREVVQWPNRLKSDIFGVELRPHEANPCHQEDQNSDEPALVKRLPNLGEIIAALQYHARAQDDGAHIAINAKS